MAFPIYPRTERQKHLVALAGELADTFAKRANEGEWVPLQRYYRDVRAGLHHPPMDDATFSLLSQQALAGN